MAVILGKDLYVQGSPHINHVDMHLIPPGDLLLCISKKREDIKPQTHIAGCRAECDRSSHPLL